MDAVKWTNAQGQNFLFYHIIDTSTNYHIAIPCEHRPNSEILSQLLIKNWIHWAGPPKMIIHDSAGEFCSEEFARFLQGYDIRSSTIPAEAHWQLGRCERHGAVLQAMLDKWQVQYPINTFSEFETAISHNIAAKNSLSRHRGYSPEILVLGKSRHMPACNTNDDMGPADWLADAMHDNHSQVQDAETQKFLENLSMREQARIAFVKADHDMKLRRSLLRRSRPERAQYVPGQWVMYWRSGKGALPGSWHGPARVVLPESQGVIWVSHQSRLYRCAPEHLRNLSQRESESPEVRDATGSISFPRSLGSGVFQYQDLTSMTNPNNETNSNNMTSSISNPITEVVSINSNPNPTEASNIPNNTHINPHEEIQPDAEPDANSQPSISITPNSQDESADPPEGHQAMQQLPSTIPRGGLDVSLPETDEGEDSLVTSLNFQDHWEIQPGKLVRHHVVPRTKMFNPVCIEDNPVPLEWLESQRTTHVTPRNGPDWTHQDMWRGNIQGHQSLPLVWTGRTEFDIRPEFVSQCPNQQQYINMCTDQPVRGYEISIFLAAHEIEHCSRQNLPDQIVFLASNAKKQRAEVKEKDLSPSDRLLFQGAKAKEVASWLSTETVRRIARSQIPEEQILRSRWVLTWKPRDDNDPQKNENGSSMSDSHKPKARLVILGFEDPQIENLARDSPTLGKESRTLILQYAASAKWRIRSFDVQTAFLRGSRTDGRILGMEPPLEMRAQMKLQPWECCELLKSAYGLCNAPLLWYEELKGALLNLGFQISPLDPCLFVLPKRDKKGIHGVVGIHVDDGLGAGDKEFEEAIRKLETRYPFGSTHHTDFQFTGIHIHQNWDGSIELDQTKYVEDITHIDVPRERRQSQDEPVDEKERQALRGLVGSLQYAATNTRPDISAKLSLLQAKIYSACVKDLLDANRLLTETKQHKDTKITIKSIPLEDIRFVSFSDAAFANRANSQSQKGCLILAASKSIGEWKASDVSPLIWYSRKIARVVASTLASEAYALSGSVDLLSWLRVQWSWLCQPSHEWKNPEKCLADSPEAYAVVDCKSLYDLIQKTTIPQCQEYRTMLEALIIKDRIKEGIQIK